VPIISEEGGSFSGGTVNPLTVGPGTDPNNPNLEVIGAPNENFAIARITASAGTLAAQGDYLDFRDESGNAMAAFNFNGGLVYVGIQPDGSALSVRANAAQTQTLANFQSSAFAQYLDVSKNGYLRIYKTSAPADAEVADSSVVLWLDATPGATKLMVKAKDSGGTVRTAAIALA